MTIPQPSAFSALAKGFKGERPRDDAEVKQTAVVLMGPGLAAVGQTAVWNCPPKLLAVSDTAEHPANRQSGRQ